MTMKGCRARVHSIHGGGNIDTWIAKACLAAGSDPTRPRKVTEPVLRDLDRVASSCPVYPSGSKGDVRRKQSNSQQNATSQDTVIR
jgi:hypothetical protein